MVLGFISIAPKITGKEKKNYGMEKRSTSTAPV
jgi:hypothetical protein